MLESNVVSVDVRCLFAMRLALKAFRALSPSPWPFVDTQSCLLPGFGSGVLLLTQIKNVSALVARVRGEMNPPARSEISNAAEKSRKLC